MSKISSSFVSIGNKLSTISLFADATKFGRVANICNKIFDASLPLLLLNRIILDMVDSARARQLA